MFRPLSLALLLAHSAGCAGPTPVTADGGTLAVSSPRDAGRPELPSVDAGGPGGGGAPVDAGGVSVTAVQACQAHGSALCARWNACAPFYLHLWFGTVAACTGRMSQLCELQLAAPGTVETPAMRARCARELEALGCGAWLGLEVPEACKPAAGPLASGRGCSSSWQCQSSYCASAGGCGVCAPRSSLGEGCSEDAGCSDGLVCSAAGTCTVAARLGEGCSAGQPCQPGAYCNLGLCAALQGQNASCSESSCNDLDGLYCSDVGSVCRASRLASAGEACGWLDGITWASCSGASYCLLPSSTAVAGTCAVAAGDGAVCDDQAGPLCTPPAVCHDGRCRLPSSCE